MNFWMVVSNIFYFHPYLGKWSNFTNIFQMGWNHMKPPTRFEFLPGASKMRRAVVRYLRLLPLCRWCSECSLQSQHRLDCRFEPRHLGTNLVGDLRNADLEEKTRQLSHSLYLLYHLILNNSLSMIRREVLVRFLVCWSDHVVIVNFQATLHFRVTCFRDGLPKPTETAFLEIAKIRVNTTKQDSKIRCWSPKNFLAFHLQEISV